MNMKIGTKWQTHNGNAGHFTCGLGNYNLKGSWVKRDEKNIKYRAELEMLQSNSLAQKSCNAKAAVVTEHKESVPVSHHLSADTLMHAPSRFFKRTAP